MSSAASVGPQGLLLLPIRNLQGSDRKVLKISRCLDELLQQQLTMCQSCPMHAAAVEGSSGGSSSGGSSGGGAPARTAPSWW